MASSSVKNGLPKSEIKWSEKPEPLKDILHQSNLPVVVKLWTDKQVTTGSGPSISDIHQPLLLYKELREKKIYAKNVTSVDVLTGAICREDPVVVIPVGYKGWFRLIDDVDKPMTTLGHVARIMPVRFLICKAITGFSEIRKSSTASSKGGLFERRDISPGVFRVNSIYEDFVRYSEKKNIVKRLMRCLKCTSENGTDVLIPLETEGIFYLVETRKSASKKLNSEKIGFVYNIEDMLEAGLSKNVILSLLSGKPPSKQCGFTYVLKVCDVIRDHTVIACTLSDSSKLLELPIAPNPFFLKAVNIPNVENEVTYKKSLNYISKNVENYMQELKVRYNYRVEATSEDKRQSTEKL